MCRREGGKEHCPIVYHNGGESELRGGSVCCIGEGGRREGAKDYV